MCKKEKYAAPVGCGLISILRGVDLAHACCGLNEHLCFFSYLIYQTGVAVTGGILLSASRPIAS